MTAIGTHRVLSPPGALPQAAERLCSGEPLTGSDIEIDVGFLNLDSASYRDLVEHHDGNPAKIRAEVLDIVATRGKMSNPRTGSGGMLVGRVSAVADPAACAPYRPGDRVATLISLTATPLQIRDSLQRWDTRTEVVPLDARAVVAAPRMISALPDDLPEELALAVLDVCGAPAQAERILSRTLLSGRAQRLLLLGGGKSAVLSAAAARRHGVQTVSVVPSRSEADALRERDLFDLVLVADATDPLRVRQTLDEHAGPADVTFVCVNAPGCEHAAMLATRPGGAILYFSMATSFPAVALGAEALCLDFDLYIGSGYVPGHAELALDIVRSDPRVREFFEQHLPAR
ncbi:L-erythro-3,5-diaminohexanoate dehydrogenase [Mycobacterium frederiksbergense]|uniref:L-erythro-3,5-diaminohexanoate dehydrogenase n=1 Tax=Mycolicibacterium frederiksbergense TaxID=117567 RepID=A0ABT6KYP1_9MYCO|nr:hypothetical protein [Mycolicibacterium frederiksbergense]MDH6194945.1 L-erythro-3,5-diaminohexanoate dehydrogenase [Mycolicibacterium frederiksbergense]